MKIRINGQTNAFHEAGHAVVAYMLNRDIKKIIIKGTAEGEVITDIDRDSIDYNKYFTDKKTKRDINDDITICFAGCIAEAIFQDINWLKLWRFKKKTEFNNQSSEKKSDYELVDDIISKITFNSEDEGKLLFKKLSEKAENILSKKWNSVIVLSKELLTPIELSGKVVKSIIRNAIQNI